MPPWPSYKVPPLPAAGRAGRALEARSHPAVHCRYFQVLHMACVQPGWAFGALTPPHVEPLNSPGRTKPTAAVTSAMRMRPRVTERSGSRVAPWPLGSRGRRGLADAEAVMFPICSAWRSLV